MKLYEDLMWRGLIKDVAGEDLKEKLNGEPITFYWGTDPTADSLHIGHYSALCTAKRLANAGHHPILLCGGATGRIGDPRPTSEREIISNEAVNKNIISIKKQIDRLFNGKAEIVDNYDWTKDYTYLEFLRDIGKYINVNYMINKDIIARRLESGITYAEFSYTLLQGYDFMHLYQYLINTDDSKVFEYLKVFTFLTKEEIEDIMDKQNKNPETRIAQKTLAYEVVKDIHGKDEADHAIKISEVLFTGNIKELTDKEIEIVFKKMPAFESNNDTLINILVNNNIATSRREAREFLSNNAITLDGDIVNDESKEITNTQKYHIIRKGKKKYYLIKMNQD